MPPRVRGLPLVLSATLSAILAVGSAEAGSEVPATDGALVIVSDSGCPSAEAVRDALVGLRPVEQWPALSVAIRATPQTLVVEIGREKMIPRQLALGPDCAARATDVALVISAWTGDLPVETAGTPVLQPATPILQPLQDKEPETMIPKSDARQSEISAGLLAATAGGIAPGGRLEFGRIRSGSGLGWQLDSLTVPRGPTGKCRGRHNPLDARFCRRGTRGPLGDGNVLSRRGIWGRGDADLCLGPGLRGKPIRLVANLGSYRGHPRGCALGPNPALAGPARHQVATRTKRANQSSHDWHGERSELTALGCARGGGYRLRVSVRRILERSATPRT